MSKTVHKYVSIVIGSVDLFYTMYLQFRDMRVCQGRNYP